MTYKKPSSVSYTEMAIYVDENIYKPDCDGQKCFEYLYHLFYMLAVKSKFFIHSKDYDEYALYGATQVYLRYQNGRKTEQGKKALADIKSCLNYIKRILYPLKINYQKSTFAQRFTEEAEEGVVEGLNSELFRKASLSNQDMMRVEFDYYLKKIVLTVKHYLKELPYASDRAMMHNLYLSCLLTITKSMTMSNKNIKRLQTREDRSLPVMDLLDQIYKEESKDDIVLYHLESTMGNYVATLVARIKKGIARDLRELIGSYEPSDQVIQSILASPLEDCLEG